ncbi:MAG: tetraacyldisaccharide 4'-kinase [Chloroflexi bacterium]|nr:tetraacyldisaccharide 4'-kinase [Chloroflexota bacterium]
MLHKRSPAPVRVVIMGAAGRDFHNFNVVFRDNPAYEVVAFTAAQIPGIAGRPYPPALAGPLYPKGIPIHPEEDMPTLVRRHKVDYVYFSYSDVPHLEVMHKASQALAAGASFGLLGPKHTMLASRLPVISVCAVRTGSGKSPLSQWIAGWLRERGHRVAVLRHPMPYGDLERQAVQRFGSLADLDAANATIEEREEYEPYLRAGTPVFAGVDYARILALAEQEADIILWDGGNNDLPFLRPDLHLVVVDPHRAGHETTYHPGEANFRMADAYVISKVDSATRQQVQQVRRAIRSIKPRAPIALAALELVVDAPERLRGKRVAIVGDGPTLTHGDLSFGAGVLAAQRHGAADIVDPKPYAIGELRATFRQWPHLGLEVPAMGYSDAQKHDLEATLNAMPADAVLDATPVDLSRILKVNKPFVNVEYRLSERGNVLVRLLERFQKRHLAGRPIQG